MPGDVSVAYEWTPDLSQWYAGDGVAGPPGGPRVNTTAATASGTTTVTATSNQPVNQLFFRVSAASQ